MKIINTNFKDLFVIQSKKHDDNRGYFRELYLEKNIKKKLNFIVASKSKKNVVRGLHFQIKKPQGKYVSVIKGQIFDVAVDCRTKSATFGKHFKIFLDDRDCKSIYIPQGFAHGFIALSEEATVLYKTTDYYHPESEKTIKYDDPDLNIEWPIEAKTLSSKDLKGIPFKDLFIK